MGLVVQHTVIRKRRQQAISRILEAAAGWIADCQVDQVDAGTRVAQCFTVGRLGVALWTEMNQPMLDWVDALHRAGFRTGILSNMPDAMAEGICARFDWIESFDHAVWSHALKMRKPQQRIYHAAISTLGVTAESILFIDDKQDTTTAAINAGMQAIVYLDHDSFVREMKARGYGPLLNPADLLVSDI